MGITIRFVGGPADGRAYAIPDAAPPPLYLIPLAPPLSELFPNGRVEPTPIQKAEYEPLRENGLPRRADDGAYLYQHRADPLTAEEREALAGEHEECRMAEARRRAELDETWQEIRRERPHYPKSWRDL
ncbi:hypothetical protein ACFWMH_27130 [Streptomyces tendae]|uniref:hypothetical protein n=1 Tax=Streptomyces tendae TaxID=1932 RepID=UPI00364D755C